MIKKFEQFVNENTTFGPNGIDFDTLKTLPGYIACMKNGWTDSTTPRQLKNGTIQLKISKSGDTRLKASMSGNPIEKPNEVFYIIYSNGTIRRQATGYFNDYDQSKIREFAPFNTIEKFDYALQWLVQWDSNKRGKDYKDLEELLMNEQKNEKIDYLVDQVKKIAKQDNLIISKLTEYNIKNLLNDPRIGEDVTEYDIYQVIDKILKK